MKEIESKILQGMVVGTALAHYQLKKTTPQRTGPMSLSVTDYLQAIGRERLNDQLLNDIRQAVRLMLQDVTSNIEYDSECREFTFYFNDKIGLEGEFLYLGSRGYKIGPVKRPEKQAFEEYSQELNMPLEILGILSTAGDAVLRLLPDDVREQQHSLSVFNTARVAFDHPSILDRWTFSIEGEGQKPLRLFEIERLPIGYRFSQPQDKLFEIDGTAQNVFLQWAKKYEVFGDPPAHTAAFFTIIAAFLVDRRSVTSLINSQCECSAEDIFELRYESSVGSILRYSYRVVFFPDIFMDGDQVEVNSWVTDPQVLPDFEREVYALIDSEVNYEEPQLTVVKLVKNPSGYQPSVSWHLVDFDPETQEELLQQRYTVVAWRYRNPAPKDRHEDLPHSLATRRNVPNT